MCKKIRYKSFTRAYKQMQKLNREKGFDLKTIYECEECGEWHLSSMERTKYLRLIGAI